MPTPLSDRSPLLPPSRLFLLLLVSTVLLAIAATLLFDHAAAHRSLFLLGNLVGPTTESLLHGQGLVTCTDAMGTPGNAICFHAARMPLPSLVVALGDRLFGNRYLVVALVKALVLLAPLEVALFLVCRRAAVTRSRQLLLAALLLLPFLLTPFLADVVNLQVEEGYSYSLLALAFALLLFLAPGSASAGSALLFGFSVAGLYLSKSSMLPAAAVLAFAFAWQQRGRPTAVALALLFTLLAPAGWAIWQHHTSGRYSLGTSLDGINLHKGNNPAFLAHYPPAPGETLDQFDSDLNRGHSFGDEWTFNSFHEEAALLYMREHPAATLDADGRKLTAILFTLRKLGSEPAHGAMQLAETAGILLFRLLLWAATLISLAALLGRYGRGYRFAAGSFLLLLAAVALPYLLGFAYTRHISVLIYPSTLLCCRLLLPADPAPPRVH